LSRAVDGIKKVPTVVMVWTDWAGLELPEVSVDTFLHAGRSIGWRRRGMWSGRLGLVLAWSSHFTWW